MRLITAHINVTQQCNFRCRYCFVNHDNSTMSPETARRSVDWLARNKAPTAKSLYVDFFGGEPTLNWPAIVAAVEYAEREYPGQFRWGIVTNCSLLDSKRMQFLAGHHFSVLASYDGRHTHNETRAPGTRRLVEQTIRDMVAAGIRVNGAMTLVPGHTRHLFENFVSFAELGVQSIGINPVYSGYRRMFDEEDWRHISEQYDRIVDWLFTDRRNHHWKPTCSCSLLERHLPGIKDKAAGQWHNPPDWACGACKGSLGIWPNGEIMPCHEHAPKTFPHWVLGNVLTGEINETKRCQYTDEKYRECDACEVTNCGHCRVRAFEITGDELGFSKDSCRYQRLLYEKAIQFWNRLIEAGADWRTVC